MEPNEFDKIQDVDLKKTMEENYIDYAMSVIVSRAIPDVRDGLKPVQRRILYAMQSLGITYDKKTKKCATIVGETMGKYHPHGDSSIYGALVCMGQPWNYRQILIDKQGNFGSEDGDPPAAMRYTEAKMSKIASFMLEGINKNTVDFVPNFSNEYEEPVILPARFPNLLVNGATGIAVGMATNIPPHNLTEVIDAVNKIIEDKINDKETVVEDLLQIIKGPDFPTGALILSTSGIRDYLTTGRGKIKLRSVCEIETLENGKQRIIVKELPYLVHRSELIKKIADLVKDKKVEGITNIVDVRGKKTEEKIHIELKKDANAKVILNKLYKHTDLQTTYSIIMLSIVNGEPKILNVLQILNEFLKHQEIVVKRRTKFDLNKCEERIHIVYGLIKAISVIDEVINTIKESKDTEEAEKKLIEKFEFTEKQANAIVEMKLKSLTNLESKKLEQEQKFLETKIAYYKEILNDDKKLLGVIRDEIIDIKEKNKDERNTKFSFEEDKEFNDIDLIEEENIVVTMTNMGYIKRMGIETFKTQNRGGKGIKGMTPISEDFIKEVFMTTNHSTLMFITNLGRMYVLKGYEIPEAGRTARGTAIINLLNLKQGEYVTACCDCKEFLEEKYLLFITKKGIIKKTKLNEYAKVRLNGIKAINLKENDELISAKITNGKEDVLIITKNGFCNRFNEETVRDMTRTSIGVRGIRLRENDEVIAMLTTNEGKYLLIATEKGIGKRTNIEEFSTKGRGGKGMICYKPDENTGKIVGSLLVNDTGDIMIINEQGLVIRMKVEDISIIGRQGKGVKLMKVEDDIKIASITKVVDEEN